MRKRTYNDIKKEVGSKWALILNPEYSNITGKLLKGVLEYYHKDKNKVERYLLKNKDIANHVTVLFFGNIKDESILVNFL